MVWGTRVGGWQEAAWVTLRHSGPRYSQSSASHQPCSAGSSGGACVSLNTALLSMGSGGTETLLFSTCSQLPEKPQVSP